VLYHPGIITEAAAHAHQRRHDRSPLRNSSRKNPPESAGRLPGRRLRGGGADEHLLQPARAGWEGDAADPPRHPRGCPHPVRVWDRRGTQYVQGA